MHTYTALLHGDRLEWLEEAPDLQTDAPAEYTAAVAEIDQLLDLDPPPHSEAYERLEFLSVLVHAYEEVHCPLEQLTTPQDVVTFMLEQKGLSQTDLAQWLGGASPMLAFLQGTCSLSLPQIERLRVHLGIPADLLISPAKAPNTRLQGDGK